MAKETVLYVEDEENDVFFMQFAFKEVELRRKLTSVPDGRTAVAYLAGEGAFSDRTRYPLPQLVLLDLNLPLLSGFDVLNWIRQQPQFQQTPVVVFSSSGRPEDREKARELGADHYVLKPASGMQFVDIVKDLQTKLERSEK